MVLSINEVSHDTTIADNDAIERIEAEETMASVWIEYHVFQK